MSPFPHENAAISLHKKDVTLLARNCANRLLFNESRICVKGTVSCNILKLQQKIATNLLFSFRNEARRNVSLS